MQQEQTKIVCTVTIIWRVTRLEQNAYTYSNKTCPQKWPPLQAWCKTKESQTGPYSTHKKIIKRQHENVECVCEKISRKKLDFSVLSVVFLCIQVHWSLCMQSAMSWWNTFPVFQKQLQLPSAGRNMGSYKYNLQWHYSPYQPFMMEKVAVSETSEIIPAWYSWLSQNMLLCLLVISAF